MITADKNLCPDCGGVSREILIGSGEYDFLPHDENQWYRRAWHTDSGGHIHDETTPIDAPGCKQERPPPSVRG